MSKYQSYIDSLKEFELYDYRAKECYNDFSESSEEKRQRIVNVFVEHFGEEHLHNLQQSMFGYCIYYSKKHLISMLLGNSEDNFAESDYNYAPHFYSSGNVYIYAEDLEDAIDYDKLYEVVEKRGDLLIVEKEESEIYRGRIVDNTVLYVFDKDAATEES